MPDPKQPQQAQPQPQEQQADPDTMNNMERQQRRAYWKGEEQAARRLPAFTPRDPLAGAALEESERIEEELWNMEVEAQNMLDFAQDSQVTQESSQQQLAQKALHMINEAGGELSPQALDDWIDFQGNEDPTIYDRPSYEQKAMFYNWLRAMEDVAQGREPQERQHRMPTPSPEEQRENQQRKDIQGARGNPYDRIPEEPTVG